ncbi:hypothetical protein T07_12970 [Trichinella nelsoni]|uniref:Uncharacterized protein n=1 Tax=Trichinella nelsoni TaxID=6336 RepID=A0A0V0RKC3_9BILA|nr:hypothetical protein T07_12970 [Trichinella nelsoni]
MTLVSATRDVPLGKYLTELLACKRIIITVLQKCISGVKAIRITNIAWMLSCFFSFPVTPTKLASSFWKVPRQTNASASNKWPLKLLCAYLNTQGSSPSETPLKRIDNVLQHYNGVFVENAECGAIFRCFGQVDFPSFSVHFEYMVNSPFSNSLSTEEETCSSCT